MGNDGDVPGDEPRASGGEPRTSGGEPRTTSGDRSDPDDVAGGHTGALDGVLIADFSRVLAGPYATMLLADLGADVIKVEQPGTGDDTRSWGPPYDPAGDATYYLAVNRNKRSVALDLRSEQGRRTAVELAARADVVVENFRPGAMERLGLGYAQVRAVNPGVVYCSITGFGAGAGAHLPGYDLLVQATGGLMSVTGPDPGTPTKVGVALVDVVAGLHATMGVLAALRHRDRTGQGQRVEVNLLSSLLSALVNQASGYLNGGVVPRSLGNRHPSITPYELLPTADRPVVIAVGNERQFRALSEVLDGPGQPGLADDPRFIGNAQRVRNRSALVAALCERLLGWASVDLVAALQAAGVPCGPVNDVAEAFTLADRLGLDPVVGTATSDGLDVPQVAHPVRMSATAPRYVSAPPRLGEHTDEILRWLAGEPLG